MIADKNTYLLSLTNEMAKVWPDNHTVNIVCHGHSIPSGYTANHVVRTFDAYPHLMHQALNKRFPCAVINVIVTAIGGEGSISGAKRFETDVLPHKPKLVTIDYARNDRFSEKQDVERAWRKMIELSLEADVKVILLTPAPDCGKPYYDVKSIKSEEQWLSELIRRLADEYAVGLADCAAAFEQQTMKGHIPDDFLISVNHPNRAGHEVISHELMRWFPFM